MALYEDNLTDDSSVQLHELGVLRYTTDDKIYRYVQNIDLTAADGWALCAGSASNPNIVSGDATGGSAITTVPRGVAVGAIAKDAYGWILVSGYKANVLSDGGVAAGDGLIKHASTDGGVDTAIATSTGVISVHQSFGLALAADTTTRVKALINTL